MDENFTGTARVVVDVRPGQYGCVELTFREVRVENGRIVSSRPASEEDPPCHIVQG